MKGKPLLRNPAWWFHTVFAGNLLKKNGRFEQLGTHHSYSCEYQYFVTPMLDKTERNA
jgi:hypothetical protein